MGKGKKNRREENERGSGKGRKGASLTWLRPHKIRDRHCSSARERAQNRSSRGDGCALSMARHLVISTMMMVIMRLNRTEVSEDINFNRHHSTLGPHPTQLRYAPK